MMNNSDLGRSARKFHYRLKIWGGIGLLVLGTIAVAATSSTSTSTSPPGYTTTTGIDGMPILVAQNAQPQLPSIPLNPPKSDPATNWRSREGQRIDDLTKENNDLKQKVASQNQANDSRLKQLEDALKNASNRGADNSPLPLPPATSPPPSLPGMPPPSSNAKGGGQGGNFLPSQQPPPPFQVVGIETHSMSWANKADVNNAIKNGGGNDKAIEVRNSKTYLPSGSIMRVVILGGLDAKTGGNQNPLPALFKAVDDAQLPNAFRNEVKGCHFIGSSHGDIASERAYVRIESMSCIRKDGNAIDIPLSGYVAGEDGKAGIRGRLVSKTGQLLANTLMAGMLSGFGQVMAAQAQTQTQTALGTTSTIDPEKALKAGAGMGISNSMDRLAKYYINLAENIFPVIEVDAGRVVDLVVSQGRELEIATSENDPAARENTAKMADVVNSLRKGGSTNPVLQTLQ